MSQAPSRSWSPALGAVVGSLCGAACGSVLAGVLDGLLAARASGTGGLIEPAIGLCLPVALGIGCGVLGLRALLLGGASFSPAVLWRWLSRREGDERARWAVGPPLAALGGLLLLVALAGSSARLLGGRATGLAGGGLLALSATLMLGAVASGVHVLGEALAKRPLARSLHPGVSLLLGLGAFALGLTLLVAFGETGGGGGPFGILGVLRRQELDLRAPGLLLGVALLSLSMPSARGRAGLVLASLPLLALPYLTLRAYRGVSLTEPRALAIERHAPLARLELALLRRWADRDRDGVSAAFGGGDCDDRDPGVSPRADDTPGNGRDEDCSGGDARAPAPLPAPSDGGELGATAQAARARLPDGLNVVLITIDTLRADLGFMGYGRQVSPNLDALAKQSVVFERAYSLASYTGKSMGPLMIGKYASELEGGFLHFNRYSSRETFVQERLKAAGVHTLSVQGYWYFYQNAGFERGFDVIDSRAAPKLAAIEGDQSSNSDEQSTAAVKLLGEPELDGKRFFMWLHYVDPHAEYAPHPEHDFGSKPRDRYDGEVAFVDQHVGRVLDALAQSPFAERTAIVVTSDHGEAFGEHGMIRHGFEVWEELVRVPLIVRVPGVPARRITARRSGIDLVPTLLELFKLPFEPRGAKDFLSGESLVPDLFLPPGSAGAERPVFIDMARGPHNAERQALIEGDQKLISSEGRVLGLYDLAADPAEKHDLSADREQVALMRERLAAFRSRLRRVPMPKQ